MPARVHWSAEAPDLFTASTDVAETHARVFLVAEAVSDGSWDWATWSRYGRHSSLHGYAATQEAAMRKAELAANAIRRTLVAKAG